MNKYELVKIEGNIAYLLDTVEGRVLKTSIDDRTGNDDGMRKPQYIPNQTTQGDPQKIGTALPFAPRLIDVPNTGGTTARESFVPSVFRNDMNAIKEILLPDKPVYVPPPPHLAGVMIPEGNPGSATETRMT